MKSRHIIKILDRNEFRQISVEEMSEIKEHSNVCQSCRAAFQAAKISSTLLKQMSLAKTPEVPPFFEAKVLRVWRETQMAKKPVAVFWRWWQASATLVLLMFLTVIGLISITLLAPDSETAANRDKAADVKLYSAETIILNRQSLHSLTPEQVYEVLDDDK